MSFSRTELGSNSDLSNTWALPHEPQAAGIARRLARHMLEKSSTDCEVVDQTVLVISELVTNAIEHARAPVGLAVHVVRDENIIQVEVSDGGAASSAGAWSASRDEDECGRGATLVEHVAVSCGRHEYGSRVVHWAKLSLR